MGVSLLIFFVALNITLGMVSITLAHITFCIGFVALVVRARLAGMDESLTEAARDLGATPAQVSIAWLVRRPGITAPIASATTPAQVKELVGGVDLALDAEHIARLDQASAWRDA